MVEWKKLGEVCTDVIVPMRDRPKIFNGSIPWCRIEDIEGMYFNRSLSGLMVSDDIIKKMNLKVFPTGTVICSCSATLGVCAINTQPLITNQTFIGLVCSPKVSNRYIFYYMSTRKKELLSLSTTGTIPYVSREKFENMQIPIPSLEEQTRIVGILDTFTSAIDNLKEQIAQRRKQYEYYRDQLLDLEGKPGVEMKTIGDIAKYRRGSFPQPYGNKEWYDGEGAMPFVQVADVEENVMRLKKNTKQFISRLAMPKSVFAPIGTIIVTLQGSIGKVAITQYDSYIDRTLGIFESFTIDINKKYFALQLEKIFAIKKEKARGGTIKTITKEEFTNFIIPLPPIEEQQRIVSILDTFEASIRNLEEQLAQRQKQYEYYRNKLLTFE